MAACSSNKIMNVSEMFDEGLKLFNQISKNYEPTNSYGIQTQIKKSMSLLEESTKLVSLAGMFSSNETVDEVPTSEIKFFLLPALLGTLSLKLCIPNRLEVVNTAEVYFKDFLTRCKNYAIIDFEIPESDQVVLPMGVDGASIQAFNITRMACQRNIKIQRFKEQQEMDKQLIELKAEMDKLTMDDDIKRNYYMTLIKSFASQAIDELDCLYSEKPLIEHRASVQAEEVPNKPNKNRRPRQPLQPIIITANEVQKKVFAAGNPSLPVMTVEEFYDKRVLDGGCPDSDAPKPKALQELAQEAAAALEVERKQTKTEGKVDSNDAELLQKCQDLHEFKDTH